MQGQSTQIAEINQALGGEPLTSDLVQSFQSAQQHFKDKYRPESKTVQTRLSEVADLLTVSEANLKELENQKWFQRAWRTVTRKNQKLKTVNERNLLIVQKGSLFFLQSLAEGNQILMKTVHFALERIEQVNVENTRLKGYLAIAIRKFRDRLERIEHRLDEHEEVVEEFSRERRVNLPLLLAGNVLLIAGILLIALLYGNTIVSAVGGALVIGAIFSFLFAFAPVRKGLRIANMLKSEKRSPVLQTNAVNVAQAKAQEAQQDLRASNRKNLGAVKTRLAKILNDRVTTEPLVGPFLARTRKLENGGGKLHGEENFGKLEVADWLEESLAVSWDIRGEVHGLCATLANDCVELVNALGTKVARSFLPDWLGLDLEAHLDHTAKKELEERLKKAFASEFKQIDDLEADRVSLLRDCPRIVKMYREHPATTIAKGFVKGLLIVPAIVDDTEQFLSSFFTNLANYFKNARQLGDAIESSAVVYCGTILREFFTAGVEAMDPVFAGFDNQGVALDVLLDKNHTLLE